MSIETNERLNIASWFIDRPAQNHPDKLAIQGEPAPVRYSELQDLTNRAGGALRQIGCSPLDRVVICLPDSVEFIAAFFGAAKLGALPVPVSPFLKAADYSFYLSDTGARIAIVHHAVLSEFSTILEGSPIELIVVGGDSSLQIGHDWERLIRDADPVREAYPTLAHDPAFLLYTSGSTAQQKAVLHRHQGMVRASENVGQGAFGIRADDRCLSVLKLFFAYGLCTGMYFSLGAGASTILNPAKTELNRVTELIYRYRPTVLIGLPSFFAALLNAADASLPVDLSSVRMVICGGEPLSPGVFTRFKSRFNLELLDGIGSTEMLSHFLSNQPQKVHPGTCGVEIPNCRIRLVGDDGQDVPDGEIGSLWVHGPSCFVEYWNRPDLTARVKRDDWVLTGDKFYRDADGFYHYCSRGDAQVKISGLWVSLQHIESVLREHPAVINSAVITREDRRQQNRLVAYVVGNETVTDVELRHYVEERLPRHMVPTSFMMLKEFPVTSTGKLDRRALPQPGWSAAS